MKDITSMQADLAEDVVISSLLKVKSAYLTYSTVQKLQIDIICFQELAANFHETMNFYIDLFTCVSYSWWALAALLAAFAGT